MKLIDALPKKDEKLFHWLIIVQPTHPLITSSAELIFLLPNTTSKLQPIDQGFSILDTTQMLDFAWGKVTTKTVVNCFEKAGISKEKQFEALLDAGNPFKDLQEQFDKLAVNNPKFFPEGTTANDIVSVDNSLTSAEPLMTDDMILCDILDAEGPETEDDRDNVSNEPICPQSSDVH